MIRIRLFSTRVTSSIPKISNAGIVKQLDVSVSKDTTQPHVKKTKIKLAKGLHSKEQSKFSPTQTGAFDTAKEDIAEVLENCLASNELLNAFHPYPFTSQIIEIKKVHLNRDLSHVDVLWESSFLEKFLQRIYEVGGQEEGKRMKNKLYKHANEVLQKKEPKFRTHLMKEIFFRRVPRIFFRPSDSEEFTSNISSEAMEEWRKEELKRQKAYQEWIKENPGNDEEMRKKIQESALAQKKTKKSQDKVAKNDSDQPATTATAPTTATVKEKGSKNVKQEEKEKE